MTLRIFSAQNKRITDLDDGVGDKDAANVRQLPARGREESTVNINNSTTETTVFTTTISGNTLGTNKFIRLTMFGECLNNTGVDRVITVRMKYGATTAFTANITFATSASTRGISFYGYLMGHDATNSQKAHGVVILGDIGTSTGTTGTAVHSVNAASNTSIAEDSTANKTLSITVQLNVASANLDFNHWGTLLEIL